MIWSKRRVADMADLVNGFPFESSCFSSDGEVPLVRIRDLLNEPFGTFVEGDLVPESAMIRNGDVVIGMDGDFNVVHWARGTAALNQRLCLLRDNGASDSRFLAYALPAHLKVINDLTYATTVKHLSSGQVRAIRMQAPPEKEQRAIADYLDRETARIDTLIEEQQRLIDMLDERRRVVVLEKVTKGLNPDVDFSESGAQWLGVVPSHWAVKALRRCGTLVTGSTPPTGDQGNFADEGNDRPWVRPQDLSAETQASAWLTPEGWQHLRPVPADSVLVGCIAYSLGSVGQTSHEATTNQQITSIIPEGIGRYLYYVMCAAKDELWASSQMNRVPILNNQRLGAIVVPVPPPDEQKLIAEHLDGQTEKIDQLITETERCIEISRERRAALITAAVTGQIDVREVA